MTLKELELVCDKIDDDGLDYCFRRYSDWNEIKDPEFQRLKAEYIKAAEALEKYIGKSE